MHDICIEDYLVITLKHSDKREKLPFNYTKQMH